MMLLQYELDHKLSSV